MHPEKQESGTAFQILDNARQGLSRVKLQEQVYVIIGNMKADHSIPMLIAYALDHFFAIRFYSSSENLTSVLRHQDNMVSYLSIAMAIAIQFQFFHIQAVGDPLPSPTAY